MGGGARRTRVCGVGVCLLGLRVGALGHRDGEGQEREEGEAHRWRESAAAGEEEEGGEFGIELLE